MNNQIKVEIPVDVENLFLSGTGHLCCKSPFRYVLSDDPYLGYKYIRQERTIEKAYAILEEIDSK